MANKMGALSQIVDRLVGYSLPAKTFDRPTVQQLRKLLLPDEEMLYHGGGDPIHELHNIWKNPKKDVFNDSTGLFLANNHTVAKTFANFPGGGYITPLVAPKDIVGPTAETLYNSHLQKIPSPVVIDPKAISGYDLLNFAPSPGVKGDNLYDELYSRFPGVLTPLARRLTGEHARGGLI